MKKTLQATAFISFIALCWLSAVAFGADYFKGSPAALFKGSTVQTGVGGVTTLTISSNTNRVLASGNHTDRLPVATTIGAIGRHFDFANRGSGTYTIQYQDGTTLTTVLPGRQKRVALTDASTSNGMWDVGFGEALSKTGDTMTGPLGLDYSNVTPDRAAYVDGSRLLRTSTSVSSQELEYLDGATSGIQAQIDAKVNRSADTMTGSFGLSYANVTPDRVAYVDGSRIVRTSTSVSSQELEYLDGVTANIQAQIAAAGGGGGSFVSKTGDTMTGNLALNGAGNALNLKIYTTNNVLNDKASITFGTIPGDREKARISMVNQTTGNAKGDLIFETNDGSALAEILRLDGDGVITQSKGSSPWIQKSGGTMTGPLLLDTAPLTVLNATPTFIRNGAVDTEVRLEGVSTRAKIVTFRNNTVDRWKIGMLSNGNFGLLDYDSAGSFLGTLISIPSGSGVISITRALTVSDTALSTFGGSLRANQDILIGQSGSGSGGKVRIFCDSGLECWRVGPAGSTGAVDLDFRSLLGGIVGMSISTAGVVTHKRGVADESLVVQTPSAAASYTIGNNVSTFVVAPTTTLSTSTVIMPASPANFQEVNVSCSGNSITSLIHLPSGSHTLEAPLKNCANGTGSKYIFHNTGSGFWRALGRAEVPTSEVFVQAATAYGSTATKVRRWTNLLTTTGSAITFDQSTVSGDTFTVNESGTYAMTYCDQFTGVANMGISVDASGTTNVQSLTNTNVVCGNNTAGADLGTCCSATRALTSGQVLRAHTDGTANGANTWLQSFRIRKISN